MCPFSKYFRIFEKISDIEVLITNINRLLNDFSSFLFFRKRWNHSIIFNIFLDDFVNCSQFLTKFLYEIGIPHHPNLFLFYLYIIQYILKVLKFLYDFFDISWFTNYFSFEKKDFDAPHYPDSEYVVKTFDRLIFLFIFG